MQLSTETIVNSGLKTLLSFYNFDKETYICVVQLINQGLDVDAVVDAARKYTHPALDKPGSTYANDHMEAYTKLNSLVAA